MRTGATRSASPAPRAAPMHCEEDRSLPPHVCVFWEGVGRIAGVCLPGVTRERLRFERRERQWMRPVR